MFKIWFKWKNLDAIFKEEIQTVELEAYAVEEFKAKLGTYVDILAIREMVEL